MFRWFYNFMNVRMSASTYAFVIIFIALFYNSYRYPFQISSAGTSYGYSDTPIALQIGKYAILALIFVWRAWSVFAFPDSRTVIDKKSIFFVFLLLFVSTYPIVNAIFFNHADRFANSLLLFSPFLLIFGGVGEKARQRDQVIYILNRLLTFFLFINACFFLLQVILLTQYGRLPALSYEGSFLIRFGGIWDDPNGYGIFLSFFLPMAAFCNYSFFVKLCFSFFIVLLIVGTQSLTGMVCSILGFCLATILLMFNDASAVRFRYSIMVPAIIFCFIGGLLVVASVIGINVFEIYQSYMDMKKGSIDGHAESFQALSGVDALSLWGLSDSFVWGESAYVNWISSYGLFYFIISIIMFIAVVSESIKYVTRSNYRDGIIFGYCVLSFQISYIISLINLPMDTVFPVNILFIFLSSVVFYCRSVGRGAKRNSSHG